MLEKIKKKLETNGRFWICFTGDSITSCEWVHPNWRDILVYVLQNEMTKVLNGNWQLAEWGIRGFNFAYDGATTRDIVERLNDLLLVKPELVIGLMGGNDPVLGVSVPESVKNIGAIVDRAASVGSEVVWCNSTPSGKGSKKNNEYAPYAKAFMQMSEREGFFKIDMFNIYQKFPTDNFFTFSSEENVVEKIKAGEPDPQHPNQLGNSYIAKVILEDVFGISFDPERYIKDTLDGQKLPAY